MKATELRVGNWYYSMTIGGHWIESQVKDGKHLDVLDGCSIDEAKPIPLTEEWLVRFGFEKHFGIYFRTLNYSAYIAIGNDGSCGLYNRLSDYNRGNSFNQMKQIDFVHQLQNLFYCLCGEELELKA